MKKKSLEGANSICEVGDKIIELENRSIRFSSLRNIKKKELKKKNEPRLGRHHQNTNICLMRGPRRGKKGQQEYL